ncbi:MAG: SagB/ThcOx family dehydrogenase [Anaerolineae bacterium]|nr:SagB/ThcOx family dehydrogenase [Anaerolineae bacterium]
MTDQIGARFIHETNFNFNPDEKPPLKLGVPQPPLELPFDPAELISLPKPADITMKSYDLRKAIEERKSVRAYAPASLTLEELSYLLWCTQGVKAISSERPATNRTVPSAGARHAFETYLLINRVESLKPGLYRFAAIEHGLLPVRLGLDLADELTLACRKQPHVLNSAVSFFWVAVVDRMTWRYMQRGYRYLYLDAGHVCQNLYLAAESIQCGVCGIAAFDDQALNQSLAVDGESQFAIYAASLGKKTSV